jgi:hypothetical protein
LDTIQSSASTHPDVPVILKVKAWRALVKRPVSPGTSTKIVSTKVAMEGKMATSTVTAWKDGYLEVHCVDVVVRVLLTAH